MTTVQINFSDLPLGYDQIDEKSADELQKTKPNQNVLRCCVRNCHNFLARVRRSEHDSKSFCTIHGIRVSTRPTYVYRDKNQNLILETKLFQGLKKVENWRIGNENSEDALSWNVFLPIERSGSLSILFEKLTGLKPNSEPELFFWGNRIKSSSTVEWAELKNIREKLEADFRIPTEPDIAIVVPGQAVILIEAKFGSKNPVLGRKENYEDYKDDFINRYWSDPDPLIRENINQHTLDQLCRNAIFLVWLSNAYKAENKFLFNLVRSCDESNVENEMSKVLKQGIITFKRKTWEDLFLIVCELGESLKPVQEYFKNKTYCLKKAFSLQEK